MSETHWKKLVDTNFLGSWDITGGRLVLKIDAVKREKIFNQNKNAEESCIVAYFADQRYKPMILNKTNCKTLQKLTGSPYIESWNVMVGIKVEKVKAFGELVEALRIEKTLPQQQAAPAPNAEPPKCSDCIKPIEQLGNYTPEQMAKARTEKYGRPLCDACAKAEKARIDSGTDQQ